MAANTSAGVYTREIDKSVRIEAASTSIGAIVGASDRGPVGARVLVTSERQFLDTFGTPSPEVSQLHYHALAFLGESKQLYVTRVVANDNTALTAGAYLTVDDILATRPVLHLTNFDAGTNVTTPLGKFDPFNTLLIDPLSPGAANILGFFCAANPGLWNNRISIRIRPNMRLGTTIPDDPFTFHVEVYMDYVSVRQSPDESFLVSRDYRTDGFGRQMNIEDVINLKSKLIRYRANAAAPMIGVFSAIQVLLSGAATGSAVGDGAVSNGWELYRDPELVDVNILINGNYASPAVHMKMDDIAQSRGDCISVLDIPVDAQALQAALDYRNVILNLDSSCSALYAPHILVQDKFNDRKVMISPSGHVAAAYARTDAQKALWFAPAGINRGTVNAIGVGAVYNQGDRDALASAQINTIRVIPGAGYKIWGADTLQAQASALSNVNVRRLLCFIKKSVSIAALYGVYAPNTFVLRAELKDMVDRFLAPIKAGSGLYSFHVQCDDVNNPPEIVATGDVNLDVYLDPTIPAKRIGLNAIVTKTGANFKEMAAALATGG